MIPELFTQETALTAINTRLRIAAAGSISRATFYRLRDLYVSLFPRSRWLKNGRLVYGEPVVLFLYFLSRIHRQMQSFRLTEMSARSVLAKLPTGVKFSERFKSYSDIDTFFTQTNQSAA